MYFEEKNANCENKITLVDSCRFLCLFFIYSKYEGYFFGNILNPVSVFLYKGYSKKKYWIYTVYIH